MAIPGMDELRKAPTMDEIQAMAQAQALAQNMPPTGANITEMELARQMANRMQGAPPSTLERPPMPRGGPPVGASVSVPERELFR